jgi:uncharacterized protein
MNKRALGILIVALALCGQAWAGPFEDAMGAYHRHDYATTVRLLRPLADHGNAIAQGFLGVMYDEGDGVRQDYAQALKWFRLAADQGNVDARLQVGLMYDEGNGVPQDYAEAAKWYRLAAD